MHRIDRREAVIYAIVGVFLIALVMEDGKLGRIEKSAAVQPVKLKEVSPVLLPIAEVDTAGC